MNIGSKELSELMDQFERDHKESRLMREPRENWPAGYFYESGYTNDAFKAYRLGYSFGKRTSGN